MKTSNLLKLSTLLFVLILSACSMEKRVYNTGYHINWNNNLNTQNLVNHNASSEELKKLDSKNSELAFADKESYKPSASKNNTALASSKKEKKSTNTLNKVSFQNPIKKISEKNSAKSNAYTSKGENESNTADEDIPYWVLILLCFVLSPLAVGFATNWDVTQMVINLILYLLCWLPGVIHGLIVVSKSGKK